MSSVYFDPAVGGDGSTVSDDSNGSTGLGSGGHRARFVPALGQFVTIAQTVLTQATAAAETANAAAATTLAAPGTSATSATSLEIGLGSKTLTIEVGKSLVVGMSLKIASTASPGNWMAGDVTSYISGTGALEVNSVLISGSGTLDAWTVSVTAPTVALVPPPPESSAINLSLIKAGVI